MAQPAGKRQMPPSQGTELQQSVLNLHCCPYSPHTPDPPDPPVLVLPPVPVPPVLVLPPVFVLPPAPVVPPDPPPPVLPHVPCVEPGAEMHSTPVQQSALIVQAPPDGEQVGPPPGRHRNTP